MSNSKRKISYRPANANIYDVLNLPSTHVCVALNVTAEFSLVLGWIIGERICIREIQNNR